VQIGVCKKGIAQIGAAKIAANLVGVVELLGKICVALLLPFCPEVACDGFETVVAVPSGNPLVRAPDLAPCFARVIAAEAFASQKIEFATLTPVLTIPSLGIVTIPPSFRWPTESTARKVGRGKGVPGFTTAGI
jgi:hypothetical protein